MSSGGSDAQQERACGRSAFFTDCSPVRAEGASALPAAALLLSRAHRGAALLHSA